MENVAMAHDELVILLDGPVGTELARRGVPTPLPGWSVDAIHTHPEVISAIHSEYAMAGATVHSTNTFRTRERTAGPDWAGLAEKAVQLCRAAVPQGHRIAGSVAPIEDCYRPDLSPRRSEVEHARLADVLAQAGCDLLLCETFAHPGEALSAATACVQTGLPTWISLTAGPQGDLMTPDVMLDTAQRCVDVGAEGVLVNCVSATRTLALVRVLTRLEVRVGAYANAGRPDERIGWASGPPGPERYSALAMEWVEAGATLIGGCCGTGPGHIRALSRALAKRSERH